MNGMSIVVKTITRLVTGFMLLFGIYLVLHGHVSHGAGFAGGVVIALAFMQLVIVFGREAALKQMNAARAALVMNLALLVLLLVSLLGLWYGKAYFANVLGKGESFALLSAGTVLLVNAALSLTAAGSLLLIFLSLVSFKPEEKDEQ
ncbi:MAG: MnhB domain-containing protein [Endomicrobiales bacterium]